MDDFPSKNKQKTQPFTNALSELVKITLKTFKCTVMIDGSAKLPVVKINKDHSLPNAVIITWLYNCQLTI